MTLETNKHAHLLLDDSDYYKKTIQSDRPSELVDLQIKRFVDYARQGAVADRPYRDTCIAVADELQRLEEYDQEWLKKTEWVQKAGFGKLGQHRADVMRERIAELESQLAIYLPNSYPEGTDTLDVANDSVKSSQPEGSHETLPDDMLDEDIRQAVGGHPENAQIALLAQLCRNTAGILSINDQILTVHLENPSV